MTEPVPTPPTTPVGERKRTPKERLAYTLRRLPTHIVIIVIVLIWIIPAFGLLVTSFRPSQSINESGWWTALSAPPGESEYTAFCAECHGADGKQIAGADLSSPEVVGRFTRSITLLGVLRDEFNGQAHMGGKEMPNAQQAADILAFMRVLAGAEPVKRFTLDNYIDSLMGYRGTGTYLQACAEGSAPTDMRCDIRDLTNPRGMGRAFINSLAVTLPATFLPILFAAFAAYAFSWFDFRGRQFLFATLVALQVVPLQMTLVPISRIYTQLGLNGQFLGIWLFHTGFGMPYAIYLMRNFLGALPRDLFESAYLDGASHWTAFYKLAIPLAMPAIASLAIFQFLWVWNDLLVALVFLGGTKPVLTYQISNMVTSMGASWQLLTASAFISMILPMIVFFVFQRYFVRGLLAGAVKG